MAYVHSTQWVKSRVSISIGAAFLCYLTFYVVFFSWVFFSSPIHETRKNFVCTVVKYYICVVQCVTVETSKTFVQSSMCCVVFKSIERKRERKKSVSCTHCIANSAKVHLFQHNIIIEVVSAWHCILQRFFHDSLFTLAKSMENWKCASAYKQCARNVCFFLSLLLFVHIVKCTYLLFGAFVDLLFFFVAHQRNAISSLQCMAFYVTHNLLLMMISSGFLSIDHNRAKPMPYMGLNACNFKMKLERNGKIQAEYCFFSQYYSLIWNDKVHGLIH